MSAKREAPYNRLKRLCREWISNNVIYRHKKTMWILDLEHKEYNLKELRHKIETANSLGYSIELSTNHCGHVVFSFVKHLPKDLPWSLQ